MEFAEKILTLRKSNGLTQEEMAEKLNVSRQSVSKWESGQALPELEKIVAISVLFNVTTDYLLKDNEIDELSVKTDILERQQQQIIQREKKRNKVVCCVLYAIGVYLLFIAAYFVTHYIMHTYRFGMPSFFIAEFLIATAVVIFICLRIMRKND